MTGWDLDLELRGTYLEEPVLAMRDRAEVPAMIQRKWGLFDREELKRLLRPDASAAILDVADDWLADHVQGRSADSPQAIYLGFIRDFEKRRLLMLRNRMIRFELDSLTPFYDGRLRRRLAALPEPKKVGNRLFAAVLNRLSPELAAVSYQRTLLPANVPVEFWARGAALEDQRETLYREISDAGVPMPYARYYTNFDEWLVRDATWQQLIADTFEAPETVLTSDLMERDALRDLLDQHRAGEARHRPKLIYLLSLEHYLRAYFT
jgi:hypothetical protein